VVGNAHRPKPPPAKAAVKDRESATESIPPMARLWPGSGKGEMVRASVGFAALSRDSTMAARRRPRLLISVEEATELYVRQEMSVNQLASARGVHPDLLRRELISLGFTIRPVRQKPNAFDYDPSREPLLEALALGIWLGEGTRRGVKRVEVTSCDPASLRTWLAFLVRVCQVDTGKIRLSIALHDRSKAEDARAYRWAELGREIPCACRFKRPNDRAATRPMGTAALVFNSKFLHARIRERAAELAEALK